MKIAAFNVQRFGLVKVNDSDVLSTLVKVKHDSSPCFCEQIQHVLVMLCKGIIHNNCGQMNFGDFMVCATNNIFEW